MWRSGNDKLASVDLHMCHEHNDIMTGCLTIDCLRSFCLVKSRGFAHLAALGLVSMMLHYVIVKTFVLVGLIGMHKTGCSGETRLVLHVPSSS